MNPKEIDLDKIIINYIQNESRKRLYENNSTNINKDNNLNFEVLFYDEYNNKINEIDNNLNVKFKGLESEINLCQEKKESSILIVLCDDKNNNNNWYYLVNGEYFLEAEYKNKIKTYSLRVDGQFENGSNGKIDVSNTFISTNEIKIIAGDYKSFTVELRTNDGKRKNYWYEEPYSEIEVSFDNNEICTSNITKADEPGQYKIIFMCAKKIEENKIILKIEGQEVQEKINLSIIPYDAKIFSLNDDTLIENNILPSGNADNPYFIKLQLVDINNKPLDCPNIFSYQFSNSDKTLTECDCDSNQILYINNSFIIMGEYSFIIPMINKTYSFYINHTEPIIIIKNINYTEQIDAGEKANLSLSLDIKDKYNNSIPKEEIDHNLEIILESESLNINSIIFNSFINNIEENNVLINISTKDPIVIMGNYSRIMYNGKDISNYITEVTASLPDIRNTVFMVTNNHYSNGSEITCFNLFKLEITPKDRFGNEISLNEFKPKQCYFPKDENDNVDINCTSFNYRYDCNIDCADVNGSSIAYLNFEAKNKNFNYIFYLTKRGY